MKNFIQQLFDDDFLQTKKHKGTETYFLTTPCRFVYEESIVKNLINHYLAEEEIGGIFWAEPKVIGNEKVYLIRHVKYLRNAIEDKEHRDEDGRILTKKNAYIPDAKEYFEELKKIFASNNLPLKFHSHPTKGNGSIEDIMMQLLHTETSIQDQKESQDSYLFEGKNILMPRALIVGNGDFKNNIFIGLYDGSIAPVEFEESKRAKIQENMNRVFESISSSKFSENQKFVLVVAGVLTAIAVIKYPKIAFPALLVLSASAPFFLTNTESSNTNYFSKLSFGAANICIPNQND
ncbi:MAG: hypothetical protein IPP32_08720 [Bacteroidetes bacterium]|nr:hypothetical protein [Bacteroidota bacterium]